MLSQQFWEKQEFQCLLKCCEYITRMPSKDRLASLAVAWPHVLHATPLTATRYDDWRQKRLPPTQLPFSKQLLTAGQAFSYSATGRTRHRGDPLPERADCLFISHFLRPEQASEHRDIYFGELPEHLSKVGVKSVTAMIDHSKAGKHLLGAPRANWHKGSIPRIVLASSKGFVSELSYLWRLRKIAHELRREAHKKTADKSLSLALNYAARDACMRSGVTALRLGQQIGALVKRLKPKLLITTYEGHSWERVAYCMARMANPNIICVGYQHAVLFPCQPAMKNILGQDADPDWVMTVGEPTRRLLAQDQSFSRQVRLRVIGSCRAFKQPENKQLENGEGSDRATCLIAPEGLFDECKILGSLALKTAKINPQTYFRLRLHPLISAQKLCRAAPEFSPENCPKNFTISADMLENDLQRCRWVLYQGSSVAITACAAGLRPLYYSPDGQTISSDVLFELNSWRKTVRNAEHIANAIASDLAMTRQELNTASKEAQNYCQRYFSPLDIKPLLELLAE